MQTAPLARISGSSMHFPGWSQIAVWTDDDADVEVYAVGDPTSPPIVFIHGWGLSPRGYRPAIDALAAQGWYVVAPSLPGFGGSDPIAGGRDTLIRTGRRIADVVESIGLPDHVPAVAHSYGSGVLVWATLHRPTLFGELTLVCPIGGAGSKLTSWTSLVTGLRHEVGRSSLARMVDTLPSVARHPAAVITAAVTAKQSDLVTPISHVASTGIPVHLIVASNDGVVPPARLLSLNTTPNIDVRVVRGTHGWLLEFPEEFAKMMPLEV